MFTRILARAGGGPVDVDAQVLAGVVRPVLENLRQGALADLF
ncbi:hypothetical protein RKE30_13415 [Streptomyces sp. Li-HN-5-11]|nr:hypothetical protein [Streptomyces sp. Li-HN-5-11]WNM31332.1 hypothetical protein RKE30_13415 [Streptomyces sp. Li-HN-5-11]